MKILMTSNTVCCFLHAKLRQIAFEHHILLPVTMNFIYQSILAVNQHQLFVIGLMQPPDLNVRLRLLSFIELYDFSFLQAGQLHNIH